MSRPEHIVKSIWAVGTLATGSGWLVLLALLLFLLGCGQKSGGSLADPPGDSTSGALSLQAVFGQSACIEGEYTASPSGNVCNDYLIDRIGIRVIDVQDSNRVVAEDQWECNVSERTNTIGGVRPSGNIKVILQGYRQGEDQFIWEGVKENIVVAAGQNTDAGRICLDYKGDDHTPPVIESAAPSAGAEVLPRSPSIKLQFSEDIVPESLTPEMLSLTKGTDGPVLQCRYDPIAGYDAATNQATIVPETELEGLTEYTLTVNSADIDKIQDRSKNEFDQTYSWTFVTAPIPKIWYVDGSIVTSGNGESWGQAFKTIQEGIEQADETSRDEVWVRRGGYQVTEPIRLNKGIAIYGGFEGDEVSLSERNSDELGHITEIHPVITSSNSYVAVDHLLVLQNGSRSETFATIDGIEFSNGGHKEPKVDDGQYPKWNGGGIYCDLTGSHGKYSLSLANCAFESNSANSGGAIYLLNIQSAYLDNCSFLMNAAVEPNYGQGGAIFADGSFRDDHSKFEIKNCKFSSNHAVASGGAIRLTFDNNNIYIVNSVFDNNIVQANELGKGGGAIYIESSSPKIINCTFFDNGFSSFGSDLGKSVFILTGTPSIVNSILWSSTAIGQEISSIDEPQNIHHCDIRGGYSGIGNFDKDPLFEDPDFHLSSVSPCRDAGDNELIDPLSDTDYEGNDRIIGGTVDIGAYEFQTQSQ